MCYKCIFILEFFLASQLLGLGASVSKTATDTRNTMSDILSPLCFTVSFKNWCITFLLIKAFLRILYHSFARHIHILQWKLLLSEQCALTIYLLQQPSWLLTRQALEISNSLPLHKIAWGIYRMKEIRAWQILKLLVSLFLKKRNAFRQALVTWTIEEHILDFKWKYCPDKILVEIPTCHPPPRPALCSSMVRYPGDALRPADERKRTQMESETENAYWLTQLEVDPGCYFNLLL